MPPKKSSCGRRTHQPTPCRLHACFIAPAHHDRRRYQTGGSKDRAGDGEEGSAPKPQRRERRGVKSLGLKKEPKQKFWRGKPVSN